MPMPKVLKITRIMQCPCNISRRACVMKLIFQLLINISFLHVDTIFFNWLGQACAKYTDRQAMLDYQDF